MFKAPRIFSLLQWALVLAWGLFVCACSPPDNTAKAALEAEPTKTPAQQYAALGKWAKGIAVGPAVSDYTVYVLFDPQCLHCARLWEESQPLLATVRFVWVPVAFFDGGSRAQSAALLGSTKPREEMDRMVADVLARKASPSAPADVPAYLDAVITANTDLINRFHVLAVPYVVARNQTTSEYVARQGGMSRAVLQKFLGLGSR